MDWPGLLRAQKFENLINHLAKDGSFWPLPYTNTGVCSSFMSPRVTQISNLVSSSIALLFLMSIVMLHYLNRRRALKGKKGLLGGFSVLPMHLNYILWSLLWLFFWGVFVGFAPSLVKVSRMLVVLFYIILEQYRMTLEVGLITFLAGTSAGKDAFLRIRRLVVFFVIVAIVLVAVLFNLPKAQELFGNTLSTIFLEMYVLFMDYMLANLYIGVLIYLLTKKRNVDHRSRVTGFVFSLFEIIIYSSELLAWGSFLFDADFHSCIPIFMVLRSPIFVFMLVMALRTDTKYWARMGELGALAIFRQGDFNIMQTRRGSGVDNIEGVDYTVSSDDENVRIEHVRHGETEVRPVLQIPYLELESGKQVGSGANGGIFMGKWKGSDVAIKSFYFDHLTEVEILHFNEEAKIACQLKHPNIVETFGICVRPPKLLMVLELCQRGSLYKVLRNNFNQLDWVIKVRMMQDVARGMAFMHSFRPPILHRDLKSLNLLVHNDGSVKICDFGESRIQSDVMTNAVGTTAWMAPEVLKGTDYTEKCDVYSFGVVMYELITGKLPWQEAKWEFDIVRRIQRGERPVIPRGTPKSVKSLTERCWHADPKQRPSFEQILGELVVLQSEFVLRTRNGGDGTTYDTPARQGVSASQSMDTLSTLNVQSKPKNRFSWLLLHFNQKKEPLEHKYQHPARKRCESPDITVSRPPPDLDIPQRAETLRPHSMRNMTAGWSMAGGVSTGTAQGHSKGGQISYDTNTSTRSVRFVDDDELSEKETLPSSLDNRLSDLKAAINQERMKNGCFGNESIGCDDDTLAGPGESRIHDDVPRNMQPETEQEMANVAASSGLTTPSSGGGDYSTGQTNFDDANPS